MIRWAQIHNAFIALYLNRSTRAIGLHSPRLHLEFQCTVQKVRWEDSDLRLLNQRGLMLVGLGAVVTLVTSSLGLWWMQRWARASVISSLGAASGLQTQPATLAAAFELSQRSEETYVAYALVYPMAMIGKILLAQLIVLLN